MRPVVSMRALLLAPAVALLALSAVPAATAPRPRPPATPTEITMAPPVQGRFEPFTLDQPHAAFPTAVRLEDGRIRMMWREGSSHISADGRIMSSVGDPSGADWSTPERVSVDGGEGVRDPHLGPSGLSQINGEVWLTYFVSVNGTPSGARAAKSTDGGITFEPSVRIDPDLPYAAISSPIVKVGNRLMVGFYGRKPGEGVDTAWAAWSTDNGETWTSNRIANGVGAGHAYTEPWVVTDGSTAVFMFRDGAWNALASRSTPDGGVTWSAVNRNVITSATGNSASVWASNGKIYMVYRHTQTRAAMLASSANAGVTWVVERTVLPVPAGSHAPPAVGMTYGHPIELGAGYLWCPIGMERTPQDSRLYVGYL